MCKIYSWHYSCNCPAPKLPPRQPYRCSSFWHKRRLPSCQPTYIPSYLSFPCKSTCQRTYDPDLPESYEPETTPFEKFTDEYNNENWLYHGKVSGETSQEDRYFGRSRSPFGRKEGELRVSRWKENTSPDLGIKDVGLGIGLSGWKWEWNPGMGIQVGDVAAAGVGAREKKEESTWNGDGWADDLEVEFNGSGARAGSGSGDEDTVPLDGVEDGSEAEKTVCAKGGRAGKRGKR